MIKGLIKNNIYRNPCKLYEHLSSLKSESKLLIISSSFHINGKIENLKGFLKNKNVNYKLLFPIKSNPTLSLLGQIKSELGNYSFTHILAIGGGSVIDIAKILKIIPFFSFEDQSISSKNIKDLPYLIVIPTTIGTGAEVTPFLTLWDQINFKKLSIEHYSLKPDMIINDVDYLRSLSGDNLLYPVLDALSHTLESIWNINSTKKSRCFAFSLAKKINDFIKLSLEGKILSIDLKKMQIYSQAAGLLISVNKTAIAHSISYPLTAHKNVPHGLGVSFTLIKIIDNFISNSTLNKKQTFILCEIKSTLKILNLKKRIYNYVTKIDLIKYIPEMKHPDRIKNFSINDFNIRDFIL